ncbi:GNAT family N-acetyltransferase [Niallia sp. FSL R7-0271]|uniref:GNAT family N-acetyltransferase n=1 Tax=Niallia sp. FSL R7-0271 TaxID=2921678 RepID=UPI0030FB2130
MHLIEIRRPLETDRKELQHFFDIMLKSTFDKNGIANLVEDRQTELQEKQDQLNEDFASSGKKRYFLLATDKATGDLLGCIAYGPVSALIVRETKGEFTDMLEVGTAFVHPDHQNKGIGTLLLQAILEVLKSKGIKEYCLDSGYQLAQKVWTKKLGSPYLLLEDYWGEGAHHMIWRRQMDK